jgi:hypothetical protein
MRLIAALIPALFITGSALATGDISLVLPGNGSPGPYLLPYNHIIVNSETIRLKGKLLSPDSDYRFNYNDGFIVMTDTLASSDTLDIEFQVVPIDIKKSYVQYQPVAYIASDTVAAVTPSRASQWSSDLDIIGSKSFAINIGDIGEPSLTQSLDLNITGQLTRDVHIRGSVSDHNFGSSSGATRSLEELDKIFLSVQAKNFQGDFGDLELTGVDRSLLDYQRRLTGLDISANADGWNGKGALAFSPGKQAEMVFYGIDGKQGPYLLQSQEFSSSMTTGNVFLPGTEEVYLDGIKLERGNENDYTIDYYEGYIQFTPRNIITSNSRITIKIQYSPEGYRRNFANVNGFRESSWKFGGQYIGEHDDNMNPRNFEMGESERQAIQNAGAIQDSAYVSGVKYVGDNQGDYIQAQDSLGNTYYEYSGTEQGDYTVSFSRVGEGRGDYEYAGTGRYLYVGQGNGAYLPLVYYPLPENKDYGSIILNKTGDIHVESELAISRYDRNSLSSKDNLLNGIGFLGIAGWSKKDINILNKSFSGELLKLRIRSLDNEFSAPGIIDQPDFFRQYNLPRIRTATGERLYEISSSGGNLQGESYSLGGGLFENDEFDAHRGSAGFSLLTIGSYMLSSKAELVESKDKRTGRISDWNIYNAGLGATGGILRPQLAYSHEINDGLLLGEGTDGYKADQYQAGLTAYLSSKITSNSKLTLRTQHYPDSMAGWQKQFDRYQVEQGVKYGGAGSPFNVELTLARFYQKQQYPFGEELIRNMGDIKLNYSSRNLGFTYYESVNGTGRILRAREYIFVGEGKGNYRKDGEDYVPEAGGDYIEVIRQLGESGTDQVSGYEITGGLRITLSGQAISSDNFLSRLSLDSDLSHRTNLKGNVNLQAKYLAIVNSFEPDAMSYKTYDFRQRTTYRLNPTGDYLRHTYKASRSDGNDFQFENLRDRSQANILDLKLFSREVIGFLISGETSSQKRFLYSGNVDLQRSAGRINPEIRPVQALRLDFPFVYSTEKEKINNYDIKSYLIGLQATFNIRQYGRFEFNGDYTRVDINNENIFVPYVAAGGKKPGDNYSLTGSARFKLNSYSRLEMRYSYKKLGDGYTNSTLRLEARAEF